MTELDLALIALAAALVSALAASASGTYYVAVPALGRRLALRSLARDVQRLADEHEARPEPRRRHDGHCPKCGRFAAIVSDGPRGRWTRCKAHGVQARRTKRIGEHEAPLVRLSLYRDPLGLEPPCETSPLYVLPPGGALAA